MAAQFPTGEMEAVYELLTVLILWRNEVSGIVWSDSRDEHQMPYFYFFQQTSFTCIHVVLVKAALVGVKEGGRLQLRLFLQSIL